MPALTLPFMAQLFTRLAIFLSCLSPCVVHAQEKLPEFGKVDTADLQMKECPFDKGAGAMKLIDYENVTVSYTFSQSFVDVEKWVRIKIFNQKGFEHATVDIPYSIKEGASRITGLSAKTYNLNEQGGIETITVSAKDIFKEKTGNDEGAVRFAFPGVRPGSIVELKYIEKRPDVLYLPSWLFQSVIPTKLALCKLHYTTSTDILMRVVGKQPVDLVTDSLDEETVVKTYTVNNVMPFRPEPMMTSVTDNLERIDFSIIPAYFYWKSDGKGNEKDSLHVQNKWGYFIKSLMTSPQFGSQITKDIAGTEAEIKDVKKLPSQDEKIRTVYDFVRKNVKWNNSDDFFNANVTEALNNKTGSKTEINLLIINLLQRAGINALPLMVSTRENGRPDINFPGYGQFNGTDVFVQNGDAHYILDGTQTRQSFKIPPYDILNHGALVIEKNYGLGWIFVADNRPLMKNFVSVKADIDSTGVIKGNVQVSYFDYAKTDVLARKKSGDVEESKDMLQDDMGDVKIDSVKEDNIDDVEKPLIKTFSFTLEMQQTGDFYFLDPFFLTPFRKNPFIDSERHTEIDFGCNQYYSVNMFITLPGNITATDLPASKEIRLADSSFSFGRIIAKQGDGIVIRNHFEVLNPVIAVEDYPLLKQVFDKMYGLLNERLVFKKIN